MDNQPRLRETVDLRSYAQLLWRRKWMVLLPTLIAGVVGIVVTLPRFMKPVYQCSATLMIEMPSSLNRDLQGLVSNPSLGERLVRLESQIQSAEFLDRIIDNTGMRNDEATQGWAERNQKKYPDMTVDELVSLKLHRYLRQIIRVRSGDGNQIQVSAADYYPDRCYRLVRSLTTGIIEASRATQLQNIRSTGEFGQAQLLEYKRQLDEAEAKLRDFRRGRAQQSVSPGLVQAGNLAEARELRRLAEADVARHREAASDLATTLRGAGVPINRLDGLVQQGELRTALANGRKLERDYVRQSLLGGGGELSAETIAIQVARLVAGARSTASAQVTGIAPGARSDEAADYVVSVLQQSLAETRLAELDREIRGYQGTVTSVPQVDLEEQRLQQEVVSIRAIYEAFERQITTSQLSEAFEASRAGEQIAVIDPPQKPLKPVKPKRGPMIALSFVGGLVLGVLGAFVTEHHDQSFRDVRDAEERLGLRVLGTIPGIAGIAKEGGTPESRLGAFQEFLADSPGFQEFRKTALTLLQSKEPPRSILITSARSEEGKSTISACLALTLAKELPRERIVLVDLDARKPALSRKLGLRNTEGDVSSILRGSVWTESAVQNWIRPNLSVLPMSGDGDPGEYITTERVRWLLRELANRYDRVIIDSPPNLPVPDALVLGPEVDAVLLVVKAGVTPREMVRRSAEIQQEFRRNVLGVLMNDVTSALPYYYSYKHYGYGYTQKKQARG